jgi:hypothetical protein
MGGTRDAAASIDAGLLGDAGLMDVDGSAETPMGQCALAAPLLTFDATRSSGRSFASASSGNDIHLVVQEPSCGGTSAKSVNQGLSYVTFSTSGEPSVPVDIANGSGCFITRDPALVAGGADGLTLFYTSNGAGTGYELFTRDLTKLTPTVAETKDMDNEFFVAAARLSGDAPPMAAYINEPPSMSIGGPVVAAPIVTKRPGRLESEVVPASAGYHASNLAVGRLGRKDSALRGVVAWVSDINTKPGVFLRAIDANGAGTGEVFALSAGIGGSSNVAIAPGASGAVVVYTMSSDETAQEIRARVLDEDGTPGQEIRLTRANQNVRDVAIAPYARGYVVGYRRLGGQDGAEASIRLLFIDDAGNVGGARFVQETTSRGVGLDLLVGSDGRIVAVWADADTVDAGLAYKVRAARLDCLP